MLAMNLLSLLAACSTAHAATVYLAGDSTMAPLGGGSGTQGWGEYLKYSMKIPVVNLALGGRSARSYTREGRFTTIINEVKSGDIVVIEFGHNDGGSLSPTDNGRSDCGGDGAETCKTTYDGVAETVLTFPAYLENAAKSIKAKGASVLISSQTPNNPDEGGSFTYGPSRFVGLAQLAAKTAGTDYVDHGAYAAAYYQTRSVATVDTFFPNDHTHTSPAGAELVARSFVKGVLCGGGALSAYVKNSTASVEGSCIGGGGAATTMVTKTATSAAPPSTSTPASGGTCVAMYGQCGGTGWTGATSCCASSTCKVSNTYYSQCL